MVFQMACFLLELCFLLEKKRNFVGSRKLYGFLLDVRIVFLLEAENFVFFR